MERLHVECLGCGERRHVGPPPGRHAATGECPRCGYLGWAAPSDLTERSRQALRQRPVKQRRLRVVGG